MVYITSYKEEVLRPIADKIHNNLRDYSKNYKHVSYGDINERYDSDEFFNASKKLRDFYIITFIKRNTASSSK